MGCVPVKLPGGETLILCGVRRGRASRCQVGSCRRPHEALCDHPMEAFADGRTCNTKLCGQHRTRTGPDTDLCPYHARQAVR